MEMCDKQSFEVLPTPDKMCINDTKEYKVIRLRNGLTACLISDMNHKNSSKEVTTDDKSESKLSTAALCVGVGSFYNPKEFQGLAHLVEHMLFLGSKKYPIENDFDAYIMQSGGQCSARTGSERTTFHFDSVEERFENCLDRFAQFFISPLMRKESIQREIHAVEHEFQGKFDNDYNRAGRLLLSLAEQSSPLNQNFSCGNLISITSNRGIDELYNYVHEFYNMYYTADRMTLALQARLPVDVLEQYIVDKFSDIPSGNRLPKITLDQLYSETLFDTPQFKKMIYMKPTENKCEIILTWMLRPKMQLYKSKPLVQIVQCFYSEEPNSLNKYLKKKHWATKLCCRYSGCSTSIFSKFEIELTLTKTGFKNLDKVIEVVFGYLKMLKNLLPDENFFKQLAKTNEKILDSSDYIPDLIDLSIQMQIYQLKDFFTGPHFVTEYNPKEITSLLLNLIPEKMNVIILSSTVPKTITYNKVERWYSTEYTERDFLPQWMERWKSAKPKSKFGLPGKQISPYLGSLLPDDDSSTKLPELVLDTTLVQLWYMRNILVVADEYCYYFITPVALQSIKSACLTDLLITMLNTAVKKKLQDNLLLLVKFENVAKGIIVKFYGFGTTPIMVMECFDNVITNLRWKDFTRSRKILNKNYHTKILKSKLSEVILGATLIEQRSTDYEKQAVLKEIKFEELKEFLAVFFKNVQIKSFVCAKIDATSAKEITNKIIKILKCEPIESEEFPQMTIYEVPNGEHCFRVKSFNEVTPISIIENYYQIGTDTPKNCVIARIITSIIKEPLYDTLRTKEQLAYELSNDFYPFDDYVFLRITVHSDFSLEYVNTRIENFLFKQYNEFKINGADKFRDAKRNLMRNLKEDVINGVDYHWTAIISSNYIMFNWLGELIKALEQLQFEEVRNVWHDYFTSNENLTFKKFSFQVLSHIQQNSLENSIN